MPLMPQISIQGTGGKTKHARETEIGGKGKGSPPPPPQVLCFGSGVVGRCWVVFLSDPRRDENVCPGGARDFRLDAELDAVRADPE